MINLDELLEDNNLNENDANNEQGKKRISSRSVKCFVLLMSAFFIVYSLLMFFGIILNGNTIKWVFAIYMAMMFILLIILCIINYCRNKYKPTKTYEEKIKAKITGYPSKHKQLVCLSILKCDAEIELSKQTFLSVFFDCYLSSIIPFVIGLLQIDDVPIEKVILIVIALIVLIIMIVFCSVKIGRYAISGKRKRKLKLLAHDVGMIIDSMLVQDQENIKNSKEE